MADDTPKPEPEYAIDHGWLVEVTTECTGGACGAGYGHEPSCGMSPIGEVEDLLRDAASAALAQDRANRLGEEIAEIKGSLSQVAVYEGLEGSPTALLVSELVRDHEELEKRIDAAVLLCAANTEEPLDGYGQIAEVLRGGKRIADDPRELTDG